MASSRKLGDLHPTLEDLALDWMVRCEEAELEVLVYCTKRPSADQALLYRRNRSSWQIRRGVYRLVALGLEKDAEALRSAPPQPGGAGDGPIATRALPGLSWHQEHAVEGERGALAFDWVPMVAGRPQWGTGTSEDRRRWQLGGSLAADLGLTWGGLWGAKYSSSGELAELGWDAPHLQLGTGDVVRTRQLEFAGVGDGPGGWGKRASAPA